MAQTKNAEERLVWLKTTLAELDIEQKYLLIFDGIDQQEAFGEFERQFGSDVFFGKGCYVLLTSRKFHKSNTMQFEEILLKKLKNKKAKNYLLDAANLISSPENNEAKTLAQKLGGLPLALTHAVHCIIHKNIEDYNKLFDLNQNDKLNPLDPLQPKTPNNKETILTTSKVSINEITTAQNNLIAKEIIEFFAFLGHSPISQELLNIWFKITHPDNDLHLLQKAIESLCDYSMIEDLKQGYRIHSLVQKAIRFNRRKEVEKKETIEKIFTICHQIAKHPACAELNKPLMSLMIPHFKCILNRLEKADLIDKHLPEWLEFLEIIWNCNHKEGHYQEAEQMAFKREVTSRSDKDRADSLNMRGMSLGELKKFDEALKCHDEALNIRKNLKEEGDIAVSKNNLGCILDKLRRHQEAYTYHLEVLAYREVSLGKDCLDVALTKDNIGCVLNNLDRSAEAVKYHEEALRIRRSFYGENHLDVATSLNNLGCAYFKLYNYQESLNSNQAALYIREEILGNYHPDVAMSKDNIGCALNNLNRSEEAVKYHEEALRIRRGLFGENQSDVAISLFNLGCAYRALNNSKMALFYHHAALKIREAIFAPEHPDIAISISYLNSISNDVEKINHQILKVN